MTSEIRVNKIANRAGLSTVQYTDTGIIVSGIVTCTEISGLNALNIAGVSTFASPLDINGDIDVDGHTNLDNLSIAGVTTFGGSVNYPVGAIANFFDDVNFKGPSGRDIVFDKSHAELHFSDDTTIIMGTNDDLFVTHDGTNPSILTKFGTLDIKTSQVAISTNMTVGGILTATTFKGDGSQLTGVVGGAMTAYNNSNHNNVTTFIAGYEAGEDIQKQNSDGNSSIGNILIGDRAGYKAQNAYDYNIAIGPYAHDNSDGGTTNISIGRNANSNNNQNASNVISIGYQTLNSFSNNGQNCVIGHRAARFLQSGTNNLVLGQNAEPSATAMSNEITLGDGNISHFRIPGIGVSFGNNGAVIAGVVTATSFSGDGSNLSNLPASAPVGGASTNTVFFENDVAVAVNYQVTSGKNAMSAGPIAINAGIAVTVPSGSSWTIV